MTADIRPGIAAGEVDAPASKSMGHRELICAGLSERSIISGVEFSADMNATIGCLRALGADVACENGKVVLGGLNIKNITNSIEIDCGESGSTLRFFIPLCLVSGKEVRLRGHGRLMQRPQDVYEKICREQGLLFENDGSCIHVKGPLKAGDFRVRGDISSQFISGLMFALPLLEGDSRILIEGKLESEPYIEMTIECLKQFGVNIERQGGDIFYVKGGQKYGSREFRVEGDYSNAAFLEALNTVGGSVRVHNLPTDTLQGDRAYQRIFPELASGTPEVDISDCPDLGPVLFAVAAAEHGAVFTGTRRLRIKESDRVAAMAEELAKFGCIITADDNSVRVPGGGIRTPDEILDGHNDHRIVMALSVLCTVTGGSINGAQAVSKSFPDFFDKLRQLGINITERN